MITEIIAVISTLLCVILTSRRNIWAWPVGMVGIITYFFVFYDNNLFGEMFLQLLFLGQSIHGWYSWNKEKSKHIKIKSLNPLRVVYPLFLVLYTSILAVNYTSLKYLDIVVTLLSIIATYLTAKKYYDAWFYWALVNIFSIILYCNKVLYYSAMLYSILLIIAIYTLNNWKKTYDNERI